MILVTNLLFLKVKYKNIMRERELVVQDIEELQVELEVIKDVEAEVEEDIEADIIMVEQICQFVEDSEIMEMKGLLVD